MAGAREGFLVQPGQLGEAALEKGEGGLLQVQDASVALATLRVLTQIAEDIRVIRLIVEHGASSPGG